MRNYDLNINTIDISEDDLLNLGDGILETLLKDRTTGGNIILACNDYESLGDGFSFDNEITIEKITGKYNQLIQPRIAKEKNDQRQRSRNMAEVFTPSWICNAQNNLVDNAWFGRENVFNTEVNESGPHGWITKTEPVTVFPDGKDWRAYVKEPRMEITCGEAPYLASRYDTTTGELIPVNKRIGLLDRKLRLVHENTPTERKKRNIELWRNWVLRAYQSTYGFEWQGDNLLLAREAMLITYVEYYNHKWNAMPDTSALKKIAEVISWNIWQMDGLTYGIPGSEPKEKMAIPEQQGVIFEETVQISPCERLCRVMEWTSCEPLKGKEMIFKELLKQ